MLDTEVDRGLRSDIQDCLNSMLQTLAPNDLTHWLGLCRNVLSAAKTEDEKKAEKGMRIVVEYVKLHRNYAYTRLKVIEQGFLKLYLVDHKSYTQLI